ncbi:hypothetical protein ICE98_00045 [Lactococcus lactis]|nr:hypothetical protein [Lactococcus lactis]
MKSSEWHSLSKASEILGNGTSYVACGYVGMKRHARGNGYCVRKEQVNIRSRDRMDKKEHKKRGRPRKQ